MNDLYRAVFVDVWPAWAGGLAIGGFVLLFLWGANRMLGISGGYQDACSAVIDRSVRGSWRLPFIGGVVLGGLLSAAVAGTWSPTWAVNLFDGVVTASLPAKAALFTGGGVLLGFGARLAGGCTSGHAIVGVAQLARSSMVATIAFMAAGFVVTNALLRGLGLEVQ